MHPVSARTAAPSRVAAFLLALESLADEVCATFARLFAYLGALALIAILALAGWRQIGGDAAESARSGWSMVDNAVPAFSLRLTDQPDKSATYTVLRHPLGGRKDIFRWGEPADRPAAELEIYRLGAEPAASRHAAHALGLRMAPDGTSELEAAGVIDTKFGSVSLLRQTGAADGPGACLGFLKQLGEPALRLSGWSCQGVSAPVRRAMVGCMLNRLTLLSGSHDADLSALFARADGRRLACDPTAGAARPSDWVTALDEPRLRGTL
ncbi:MULTISPECIES: hypothetical protein [unclassified Bradyrhizobium]|uniref:hypothetical protein n=1 Tax=unclassified Bradyrhizobium TaxID=2631580 RepID=UPI0028E36F95|nr:MULTISPECIES: hypothetical protein [unclassified Bradyrhizobium]